MLPIPSQAAKNAGMTMRHGGAATMFGGQHGEHDAAPMKLRDISAIDEPRIDMRDEELNRVLGGGMVPGSITLLGGEPGIGKSTLTLQTILNMTDRRILYVSGEESAHRSSSVPTGWLKDRQCSEMALLLTH